MPLGDIWRWRATSEVAWPSTSIIHSTERQRSGSVLNASATSSCSAIAALNPSPATSDVRLIQ
ncbi:MAG: hypothetical protein IPL36_10000 [Nigerium sp.]|nr:hypothetical protein [Nigerium sp.]